MKAPTDLKARLAFYKKKAERFTDPDNWRWQAQYRTGWTKHTRNSVTHHEGVLHGEFEDPINSYGVHGMRDMGYTCCNGHERISGMVVRMRTSKFTLYIPTVIYDDADMDTAYIEDAQRVPRGASQDDHVSAIWDAWHYADGLARKMAAEEQEAFEEDQREQAKESAREIIAEVRNTVRVLVKAYRDSHLHPQICALFKREIQRCRATIHQQLRIIND